MSCDRPSGNTFGVRRCTRPGAWRRAGQRAVLLAAVAAIAPRATGFRATTPTRLTTSHGDSAGAGSFVKRRRSDSKMPRVTCSRERWVLKSGETENRGQAKGGMLGSVESDEANNWGMDDSIDVNAIRMKIMEEAGYSKRGEADAGQEWITIDEDGSDGAVGKVKDAVADSLRKELLGQDSLKGAATSAIVDEVLEDVDLAKFIDEEFEKGTSALRALADELKSDEDATSYADKMAQELAELFQAEEDKAAKEIERRQAPVKAKLDKATADLEEAMVAAEEARREFEGDFVLQLMSFRKKGLLRQAAFVGSILIANQAVYQAILFADDRGGNPAFALGGLAASAALIWYYGYRPVRF